MGRGKIKDQPIVSVVLSVFNGEEHILEAVESIVKQSYTNFEFIIINDASTDDTEEIVKSVSDIRIRYYVNDENIGLTKSLNRGITLAIGKYIARMDSDDISLPRRLEEQVIFMERHPEVAACGSYTYKFTEDSSQLVRKPLGHSELSLAFLYSKKGIFSHPSVMIRKAVLDKNTIKYDENLLVAQDFKLWNDIKYHGQLANIAKPLLKYRYHNSSISRVKSEQQLKNRNNIRFQEFQRSLKEELSEDFKQILLIGCSDFQEQRVLNNKSLQLFINIKYASIPAKLFHITNFYILCSKKLFRRNPILYLINLNPMICLSIVINLIFRMLTCVLKTLKIK